MKTFFAIFFRAAERPHDDRLRANEFDGATRFSPWVAMLPHL
ncbi:MAG: hypothetical protein WA629_05865 [Candidatus Aquilonibacter sp.]